MTETYEAYSKRVRKHAESLFVERDGVTVRFTSLTKREQDVQLDRWHADGVDPTVAESKPDERSAGTVAAPDYETVDAILKAAEDPKTPTFPRSPSVELPMEMWVGWVVRPYDGGWKLRRVRIPVHVLEMVALDEPTVANRREIIVAQIATEASAPDLTTRTEWGTPLGHTPEPPAPPTVEMLDEYVINPEGNRVPRYRRVPKDAYEALDEETRKLHPLRPAVKP